MESLTSTPEYPESWSVRPISEIGDVRGGSTPDTTTETFWGGEIPWLTPTEVQESRSLYIRDSDRTLTEEGLDSCSTNILPPNSVLLTTRATIGEAGINEVPICTNQGFQNIIPKDEINSLYLLYQIRYRKKYLEALGSGSTFREVSKSALQKVDLPIPPLAEQRKIASVLYNVDQAIQKTEEIIEQIRKIGKGLRQYLFTQGYYEHQTELHGTLGQTPIDWEKPKLQETANVSRGKFTHRPRNDPDYYGGDYPFIQTAEVVKSTGTLTEYSQTLNEKGASVSKEFSPGTIIITIAGNIGDTAIAKFPVYFPDSLVGLTPKGDDIDVIFLEQYLRYRKDFLNRLSTQTTQKNLNLSLIKPLEIVKPPIEEQEKIGQVLSSIDDMIRIQTSYKECLEKCKKGLMQDLLTGGVRTDGKDIQVLEDIEQVGSSKYPARAQGSSENHKY